MKGTKKAKKSVHVRVDKESFKKLRILARNSCMSMSQYVGMTISNVYSALLSRVTSNPQ